MIFQDPYSSLNPRKTVGQIVGAPFAIHGEKKAQAACAGAARDASASARSTTTAIRTSSRAGSGSASASPARSRCQPKLIVCDEPVSALDVSIQAQILNLLRNLQRDFNLTYVFISHDLSVIRQIADRIAVMYLGRVVELGDSESIYEHPKHPYTAALLSAVPRATTGRPRADRARRRRSLAGLPAGRVRLPPALPALPRGPLRRRARRCCASSSRGHAAACHYPLEHWPMTDDEIRQAEGAVARRPARTSRAQRMTRPVTDLSIGARHLFNVS